MTLLLGVTPWTLRILPLTLLPLGDAGHRGLIQWAIVSAASAVQVGLFQGWLPDYQVIQLKMAFPFWGLVERWLLGGTRE